MPTETESPLNAEFMLSVLEDHRPAVKAAVKEALMSGIKRKFEWELPEAVQKAVEDFIQTEIIPEIRAQLTADKDVFVSAATEMVKSVPVEIGKALQVQIAKNLTSSYKLESLIKALL